MSMNHIVIFVVINFSTELLCRLDAGPSIMHVMRWPEWGVLCIKPVMSDVICQVECSDVFLINARDAWNKNVTAHRIQRAFQIRTGWPIDFLTFMNDMNLWFKKRVCMEIIRLNIMEYIYVCLWSRVFETIIFI